jgi:hypothetical protein
VAKPVDKTALAAKLAAIKSSSAAKPPAAKIAVDASVAAIPTATPTSTIEEPVAAADKADALATDTPMLVAATAEAPAPAPAKDKAALLAKMAAMKKAPAKPAGEPAGAPPPKSQGPPSSGVAKPDGPMPRLELLVRFYKKEVHPFLHGDEHVASRQRVASENYARMAFATLAAELPSQALDVIQRLEAMVDERRQFLVQVRILRWLRNWLVVHVPLSAALFVLAAWHVIAALRVVPWS